MFMEKESKPPLQTDRRVLLLVGILGVVNSILWCVTLTYTVVKIGGLEYADLYLQEKSNDLENRVDTHRSASAQTHAQSFSTAQRDVDEIHKLQLEIEDLKLEMTEQDNRLSNSLQNFKLETTHQNGLLTNSLDSLELETTQQNRLLSNSLQSNSREIRKLQETLLTYNQFWRTVTNQVYQIEQSETQDFLEGSGNSNNIDYVYNIESGSGDEMESGEEENTFNSRFGVPEYVLLQLACRKGDPGERGERGQRGLTGLTGVPGKSGVPGTPGYPGNGGNKGDTGAKGEQGLLGGKGDRGMTGIPGVRGIDGYPGKDGTNGIPGASGIPGRKGTKGETGESGLTGLKGKKGDPGKAGRVGQPGKDGQDGADIFVPDLMSEETLEQILNSTMSATIQAIQRGGLKGEPGRHGIDGTPGRNGTDGTAGTPGTDGLPGTDGSPGVQGTDGKDADTGLTVKEVKELIKGHLSDSSLVTYIDDDTLSKAELTLHQERKTWHEAFRFCADRGGWLAVVNNEVIRNKMSAIALERVMWIARVRTDNGFRWTLPAKVGFDGIFTNTQFWGAGQPNNGGGIEDCVAITDIDRKWHDYSCKTKMAFLCQRL